MIIKVAIILVFFLLFSCSKFNIQHGIKMTNTNGLYPENVQGSDSLDKLLLGSSALTDLNKSGVNHVEQLVVLTEVQIIKLMTSRQSIREWHAMRKATGLSPGMRIDGVDQPEMSYPEKPERVQRFDQPTPDYHETRNLHTVLDSLKIPTQLFIRGDIERLINPLITPSWNN